MSNSNLLTVYTPGNGDCLYNAIGLNIIHAALKNSIAENSVTGTRIKTHLLPAIAKEMAARNRPINFDGKTIKESIIALLKAVPLNELKEAATLGLTRSSKSSDDATSILIRECDLYHLLRDVIAPAMRKVMVQGAEEFPAQFSAQSQVVLFDEFTHYMIKNHGLGYTKNEIKVAKIQQKKGYSEFYGLDNQIYAPIQKEWDNLRIQHPKAVKEDKQEYLTRLFNNWWSNAKVAAYKNIHKLLGVFAGTPQISALGSGLQCQLAFVDTNNSRTATSPKIENANSFNYGGDKLHYSAKLPDDAIGQNLASRMTSFGEKMADLKKTEYPWARLTPQTILKASDDGYISALQQTTFGKHLKSYKDLRPADILDKKEKAEADDLLYAIELQEIEIKNYRNRR